MPQALHRPSREPRGTRSPRLAFQGGAFEDFPGPAGGDGFEFKGLGFDRGRHGLRIHLSGEKGRGKRPNPHLASLAPLYLYTSFAAGRFPAG